MLASKLLAFKKFYVLGIVLLNLTLIGAASIETALFSDWIGDHVIAFIAIVFAVWVIVSAFSIALMLRHLRRKTR